MKTGQLPIGKRRRTLDSEIMEHLQTLSLIVLIFQGINYQPDYEKQELICTLMKGLNSLF